MAQDILFDPLVSWPLIWGLAALAMVFLALQILRRLSGWPLRALAAAVLVTALANPALQREEREDIRDIVLLVVDETASQRLSDRAEQSEAAIAAVRREVAALDMELREVRVGDAEDNQGSLAMAALSELVAETARARIAGALMITDGQIHDPGLAPDLPAPFHTLLTGYETDWDRRLVVQNAPSFAILDEEFTLVLRVEDLGVIPSGVGGEAELLISIDGAPARSYLVPVGVDMDLPLTLPHAGMNVIQFEVVPDEGELTDRNNGAVLQINGVRDRLRVLLVSGQPHPGQRTWRNLLKSDPAVDLVHFTILRPPDRNDGVPVTELSLIAFPTRELFLETIDEFDLVIFDRYRRRGILPMIYLDNVRGYVERGGALLMATGPDFAAADSLFRTPLAEIMPGHPTAQVIETPFLPEISDIGSRHPVTTGLEDTHSPLPGSDAPWGRWLRQIEVTEHSGQTVMTGADGRPLLMLDRVGEGRVALLASDHAWLWDRGYEGGGPQLELLRRLAHWMMGEPELEEEALRAVANGQTVTITRQTMGEVAGPITVTGPDGTVMTVDLEEVAPGQFTAQIEGEEIGLYRLSDGTLDAVIALGPAAPREFENTIASAEVLLPLVDAREGGVMRLEDGMPDLRRVSEGRNAAGRGWLGITPREAYVTTDVTLRPILAAWLYLLLAAGLMLAAWLREGRQ